MMNDDQTDALAPRVLEPEIVDRAVAGKVRVLALTNAFTMAREERYIPEGATLADIVRGLELADWKGALVAIDGDPVPPSWWAMVRPKAGHLVTIRAIPRGGGGGDSSTKGWIQIVAGVILVIVGILLSPYTAGLSLYLVPLGIGLALSGALTLIFPPPSLPKLKAGSGSDAPVFSITGSRNVANPYGVIPRPYGQHRIFPPENRSR